MEAKEVIERLNLQPHPEGGCFRETFRDPEQRKKRTCSTAIYYLLESGQRSHWHRLDAAEVWHWYAGAPLELVIYQEGQGRVTFVLGNDLAAGQMPQVVVPKDAWQSASSLGKWTLMGCTVAPGFEFSGFELAPESWQPEG